MTREETEQVQTAIEDAVKEGRGVIFPCIESGLYLRVYHGQYSLDGVYWSDGEELFSVFMEIRNRRREMLPGLYVIGTYTPDGFSSGDLTMIRKENRYFTEEKKEIVINVKTENNGVYLERDGVWYDVLLCCDDNRELGYRSGLFATDEELVAINEARCKLIEDLKRKEQSIKVNLRQLANELEIEYDDLCELYAIVCNYSSCSDFTCLDSKLLLLKREVERKIALLYMDEYSWEQDDTGLWRKISDDEFMKRFYVAMENSKKNLAIASSSMKEAPIDQKEREFNEQGI